MFGISGGSFGGSGVKKYSTVADLPLTGVKPGTLAHVEQNLQGESALYLWTGNAMSSGWYKVATVNLAPSIAVGPNASYRLPLDGSPIVLSLTAADPEGLPVSWSFQVSAGSTSGLATVVQVGSTFTVTPNPVALENETPGSFSLTFVASDGVSLSTATSVFTLSFNVGLTEPLTAVLAGAASATNTTNILQGAVVLPGVVFVAERAAGVAPRLYDVSNPDAPVLLSTLPVDANWTGAFAGAVATNGMGRVIATDTEGQNTTRFFLWDCSDPLNPTLVSSSATAYRASLVGANQDFALVTEEQSARSISFATGVLGAQTTPTTFGYFQDLTGVKTPFGYEGGGFVARRRIGTTNDYRLLHVAVSAAGALTFSTPLSPGFPASGVGPIAVLWFDGRYAFTLTSTRLLEVWDFLNPASPVRVFVETAANISTTSPRVLVVDGLLYALDSVTANTLSRLRVYDVSNPAAPVFLGTRELSAGTSDSSRLLHATAKALVFHATGSGGVANSRMQLLKDA
jgi:hypothetical protein